VIHSKLVEKRFLPTPGAIRAACRQIQRKWSPRERTIRELLGREASILLVGSCPLRPAEQQCSHTRSA
jgi:hypothetical protein